jgi:hypothetical protein
LFLNSGTDYAAGGSEELHFELAFRFHPSSMQAIASP